jgi:hypothetical protein
MNQLTNFEQNISDLKEISKYLVDNKLVPSGIKPHEIQLVVNTGKVLGMEPITAVNSIDIIQGRVALQSKIIPALLAQKGAYINVLKDYEPIIEKVPVPMKNKETGEVITDENGNIKFYRDENGDVLYKDKIVDYITEIEFIRYLPNGEVLRRNAHFKWSYAVKAGWSNKENWVKMPVYMMMARCISRGARLYESHCINGMYDTYEMIDAFDEHNNSMLTEEGEIIYLNNDKDNKEEQKEQSKKD